jgi:plastocyanin
MIKRVLIVLIPGIMATWLFVACGPPQVSPADHPVHMDDNTFLSSSITIKKGEHITLVADTFSSHTIANGTWDNGNARATKEAGTPNVNNVQVGGDTAMTIGPFPSAGSFKLYCTVHSGMNLTVIVQ